MIQSNELRIGNLVFFNDQFIPIYEVKSDSVSFYLGLDHKERIRYQPIYVKGIKPIPITEEWLLKFGFERMHLSEFRSKYTHKETHCIGYDFSYVIDKSMEGFTWYGRYVKDIKYIHQLQNLYFALTGEDLNYNII